MYQYTPRCLIEVPSGKREVLCQRESSGISGPLSGVCSGFVVSQLVVLSSLILIISLLGSCVLSQLKYQLRSQFALLPKQSLYHARTHGLHMKRDGYIEWQSETDQEWILELTEPLIDMWRARHQGKPPKAIRNRLQSITIDMHHVSHANAYMADEGLTQIRHEVVGDETINSEKLTLWSSETRHYNDSIERRLDKHGLLDPLEDRTKMTVGIQVMESDDYRIEIGGGVDPDAEYVTTFEDASSDPDGGDQDDESE